jgi:hypothetical protein
MSLPTDYTPLPFLAVRGIPQTVPVDVGTVHLRLTIVAAVSDIPALRSLPATHVLFDGGAEERRRATSVPANARARFVAPPPDTLAPSVVRPQLVMSDGAATLGSRPILVGTPLLFGSVEQSPLLVQVLFDTLLLTIGTLTQPGELGGSIVSGIRIRTKGVERFQSAPRAESTVEEIYASLT